MTTVTREMIEDELENDPALKLKMTSAIIASALTFTANHWKMFKDEVGIVKGDKMPSKAWFKENIRDPAIFMAVLTDQDGVEVKQRVSYETASAGDGHSQR